MVRVTGLLTLAFAKGLVMVIFALAITGSFIEAAFIASFSALISGIFLLVNTLVQDRLQHRHTEYLDRRIQEAAARIVVREAAHTRHLDRRITDVAAGVRSESSE